MRKLLKFLNGIYYLVPVTLILNIPRPENWNRFLGALYIILAHLLRHMVLKMAKWHNTNKDNNKFFHQIKSVVITACGMCSLEP